MNKERLFLVVCISHIFTQGSSSFQAATGPLKTILFLNKTAQIINHMGFLFSPWRIACHVKHLATIDRCQCIHDRGQPYFLFVARASSFIKWQAWASHTIWKTSIRCMGFSNIFKATNRDHRLHVPSFMGHLHINNHVGFKEFQNHTTKPFSNKHGLQTMCNGALSNIIVMGMGFNLWARLYQNQGIKIMTTMTPIINIYRSRCLVTTTTVMPILTRTPTSVVGINDNLQSTTF